MPFYFTPWVILPLLSALVNGVLAVHAFSRRRLPAAIWLALLTTGLSGWSLSYALNTAAVSLWWKIRFFEFATLFVCLTMFSMWPMILRVAGRDKPFHPGFLAALGVAPLLSAILVLTNEQHGLMRQGIHLVQRDGLLLQAFEMGPYFKHVHILYVYLLFLCAALFCLIRALRMAEQRRVALLLILAATLPPLLVDILQLSPIPGLQLTTSFLFFSGICYWLAVFRFYFLDLVPTAKATFIAQMKDPVLVLDNRGHLADANPIAGRVLPLPPNAQGMAFASIMSVDPLLSRIAAANDQQLIEDAKTNRFWLVSSSPLLREGFELGRLLVLRDVSEFCRVQKELRQSEQRLAEALRKEQQVRQEQDRFLEMIAHEYRTPLAILQANLDLITLSGSAHETVKDPCGKMQRALDRLVDLFELARAGAGQGLDAQTGQPARLDFRQFLEELIRAGRDFWGERFQVFGLDGFRGEVYGDPALLRTAVMNLLENAVKYSPSSSPIELSCKRQAADLELVVENISELPLPADTEELFIKFKRGANSSGTAGSGLGLYLARAIINRYGGTLTLAALGANRVQARVLLPLSSEQD